MNFMIEIDSQLREYDLKSHIKVYYAYMKKWKPGISQARWEPGNEYYKFAVAFRNYGAVVMLDICLKKKLVVSPKLVRFFYVQAVQIAVSLILQGTK